MPRHWQQTVITPLEMCCPRPPERLAYGACYVYAPHAIGDMACRSRRLRTRVKAMDARWLPRYAARVREEFRERGRFRELFGDSAVLVPVPSCSCDCATGGWAAARLATELYSVGLARTVWQGLRRQHRVRKSATAAPGERPSVWQHYDSLRLEPVLIASDRLVLVDDVITKGRTLLAASMCLRAAFPEAQVSAFALVRTLGLVDEITRLVDPCEGEIRWLGEDARRRP